MFKVEKLRYGSGDWELEEPYIRYLSAAIITAREIQNEGNQTLAFRVVNTQIAGLDGVVYVLSATEVPKRMI